jgi:ribosomal protein S13
MVLFRYITWLGCLYAAIGFYREARNVERLNSEALYTEEFDTIKERLKALSDLFSEFLETSKGLFEDLSKVRFPTTPDFDRIAIKVISNISEATSGLHSLIQSVATRPAGPIKDHAKDKLLLSWDTTQKGIELAVHNELRAVSETLSDTNHIRTDLEKTVRDINHTIWAIRDVRGQFHRLSYRIRGEHRFLYYWYDKYLGYGMFCVATLTVLPDVIRLIGPWISYLNKVTSGWFIITLVWIGLGVIYWLINRSVVNAGSRWRMID